MCIVTQNQSVVVDNGRQVAENSVAGKFWYSIVINCIETWHSSPIWMQSFQHIDTGYFDHLVIVAYIIGAPSLPLRRLQCGRSIRSYTGRHILRSEVQAGLAEEKPS